MNVEKRVNRFVNSGENIWQITLKRFSLAHENEVCDGNAGKANKRYE